MWEKETDEHDVATTCGTLTPNTAKTQEDNLSCVIILLRIAHCNIAQVEDINNAARQWTELIHILYLESLGQSCSYIPSREGLIPIASNPVLLRPIQIHAGLNAL